MNFAEKLQSKRKERALSQEDLAEALGVSRQAVSKWESGQAYPETENLVQLSALLGVSLDYLLKDDLPPEDQAAKGQPAADGALPVTEEMIRGFMAERRQLAILQAVGLAMLVGSLCFLLAMSGSSAGGLLFVLGAGVGVAVLVYSAFFPRQYAQMEAMPLSYPAGMLEDFRTYAAGKRAQFSQMTFMGVLVLVVGFALLIMGLFMPGFLRRVLLALAPMCWAGALALFAYGGGNNGALDILLQTGRPRRERKDEEHYAWMYTAFVPTSVLVFLCLGFFFGAWHPGWMIIPASALLPTAFIAWKTRKR